jgi:hypothetical protein
MISDCAIQLHVAAYHAEPGYNNDTPGIGALCPINGDWSLAAGTYFNSVRKQSAYAGAAWQPLKLGPVKAGLYGGLVTGYSEGAMPFAAAVLSFNLWRGVDAHLIAVPKVEGLTPATAALSFSKKF